MVVAALIYLGIVGGIVALMYACMGVTFFMVQDDVHDRQQPHYLYHPSRRG